MSSIVPSPLGPATQAKRGSMSAADKTKLDAVTGTNTGDVTVTSPAGWLSLVGQALTFALVAASDTVAGVVSLGAQTFAGVKTFASALVASAGIQVGSLWNTNGSGASDVGVKVGFSTAGGSVNAAARLLSLRTGIGGTEVESLAFYKDGSIGGGSGLLTLSGAVGSRLSYGGGVYGCGEFVANQTATRSSLGAGAADIGNVIGFSTADASVHATAHIASFGNAIGGTYAEKWFATKTDLEATSAASGLILKSPDGTRWRLTISNAGAVVVALA